MASLADAAPEPAPEATQPLSVPSTPAATEAAEAAYRAGTAVKKAAEEAVEEAVEHGEDVKVVIDDSTQLVVENAGSITTPPPVPPTVTPSLLRHSPFQFGFLATLGGLLAFFLFHQIERLSGILVLLVLSMFLAIGLNPLVEWFMRRGLKRGLSLGIVLLGVVATVGLFVLAVVPVLSDQITSIAKNAPDWFEQLKENATFKDLNERYEIVKKITDYVQDGDFVASVSGGALNFGLALLSAVTNTFIVLVLTIYFLASLPSIKHATYQLAPASKRGRVSALGDRIIQSMGAYVGGAFLVALCAGISTLIFCFVVGLGDYAIALGFVVGLLSLIPVIGAFISGAIMTLLALTVSPTTALIALVYYLAYQQFESYFISPKIMKRAVDIPAALTVIAALVGGSLMGVIGALLAVPFAAAALLLHREVFLRRQDAS
ncbi:MAG: AI-2E family transporter [Nocardioides sp.]|uniref:AI-2E family transporter n=1 Tax=Nocardioides sp. TaxID=35761 RepID=UPI003F06DE45